MATYEEMMAAARKAHDAGEPDHARQLVQSAKQLLLEGGPTTAASTVSRRETSEAKGATVVAEIGDGFVYKTTDGSLGFKSPSYSTNDQATITKMLEGQSPAETGQNSLDVQRIAENPVAARANEFVRGAPLVGSYVDEAVGMVSPTAMNNMRASTAAMQRQHPGQTAALNIGGGLAFSAPLAIAAAPTVAAVAPTSTAMRIGAGLVAGGVGGATEGAVYGSGEGTGRERLANARSQAGVGAAAGAGFGLIGPFMGNFVEAMAKRYKGRDVSRIAKEFGISEDAARILRKAFQSNDQEAAMRIMRAGPDATLADAGRSGQALLDAAAQTGGKPLNIVDDAVQSRAGNALNVVNEGLDAAFGPVRGPRAAAREISRNTAPARNKAYGQAYSTPINYASSAGMTVEEMLDRVPPSTMARAVKEANEDMLSKGQQNLQILFDADTGKFFEKPNVQQLDEIKRALGNLGAEGVDQFGRPTQAGLRNTRLAGQVRGATIDATGGATGPYARALEVGGDKIAMDEGLQLGLDMLRGNRTTREMVQEQLTRLPQDAREMVKVGLRSHIDDVLSRVKMVASDTNTDAREAVAALKMLSSRDAQTKLRYLLGGELAGDLLPKINRASSALEMRASVARNSATAIRTAIQKEGADIMEPGVVGTAMRGRPIGATERLTQSLFAVTPGDDAVRHEQVWAEVAQVLSQRRGSTRARNALELVEKAIAGQPLSDAQSKLIANELATGLVIAGGRSANQALAPAR
ncbi:MAG: hypothetical protein GY945_06110 [Rhodobacteraceae bacterium]|nr:hypothetical protein [Paracoccaceae bacterium]